MRCTERDLGNIRRMGIWALIEKLGPVDIVFIQQFDSSYGDYTKERHWLLDSIDIDAIVKQAEIKGTNDTCMRDDLIIKCFLLASTLILSQKQAASKLFWLDTESTSNVDSQKTGLPMVSCFLSFKDKSNEAELFRMITATASRNEINNYLYKVELVSKYLPHLNIIEQMGRTGKQYLKDSKDVKV